MPDIRNQLEALMKATLADEVAHRDWTYEAIRPMPVPATWHPGQHVVGDCSKGVQYLCKWAGAPDPMHNNFGVYGNSQTLWLCLQHLDNPNQLQIGDIVTFGFHGDEHATMVLQPSDDPILWSFGHQGAPNTYHLSYDRRPSQYLGIPLPAYIPTPIEKLKAMTGWFAWVAWRLGEGDWKPYGKTNTKVRPNVPVLIPVEWWKALSQFLLNRKKGNLELLTTPGA